MDRVYTEKTETIFQFVSLGLCQLSTETTDLPESSDTKCSTGHVYIKKTCVIFPKYYDTYLYQIM